MAQDRLRCLKMAPKMLPEAPRPSQRGSKMPISSPWRHPRCQNLSKTSGTNKWLLPSRLFASNGHPKPQDDSNVAQGGPKMGPREP
eukprot:310111-Pyramimonas_sp.AAC.1